MTDLQTDMMPASREAEADEAAARGDRRRARQLLEQVTAAEPGRIEPWLKLSAMCRAEGDVEGALAAVSGALRIDPLAFLPLLLKANILEAAARADEAGEAYGHALAQRPDEVPPHLKMPIERAERFHTAYVERTERALIERGNAFAASMAEDERGRLARFASNIVRRTRPFHSEPSHFHYPGLVEREFHDRRDFPWLAQIEAATGTITDEFRRVMSSERADLVPYIQYPEDQPLRQWKELNWNKSWTAIHLVQNGATNEANARHCPETMALLEAIGQPRIGGRSPNAMFSMLAPHTRIPPHTGVANTRLVCHLPLIVPDGCWFRVGGETRKWEVGKAFVFDDTIEHEAANDSDQLRVVLIFDLWHPGLSPAERDAVAAIMAGTAAAPDGEPAQRPTAVPQGESERDRLVRAVATAPSDPAPRRALAGALARAGEPKAALEQYRALLGLLPDDPDVAADAGLMARRVAAEEDVLPLVRSAAAANPNHARVWQVLGLMHRAIDDLDPAIEALERAAVLAPRDAGVAHARARAAFEAGKPAVTQFEQARRLAPADKSVLVGLLAAMVARGQSEEVVESLRRELAHDPNWAGGHAVLARHLWTMGDQQSFTVPMESALEANPRNIELWRELVIALIHAERYEETLAAIARGRAALGPHSIFDANEAACHAELGNDAEADALFEALAALRDSTVTIRHVRHLLRTRRPHEAERVALPMTATEAGRDFWPYLSIAWRMTDDPRWQWLEGDPRLVGIYDIGSAVGSLEALAERLRALHVTVHQPLEQSLRGGTQTDGYLFSRTEPEIRALRQAIVDAVRTHIDRMPRLDPDHPQFAAAPANIRFSGSWSVRLTSGGRHANHIHPQGWFSSAFYVTLPPAAERGPEPAGWLTLGEPPEELKLDLEPFRMVEPKPGRLALFPSIMWHGTRPFATGERMTVAFDVAPPR